MFSLFFLFLFLRRKETSFLPLSAARTQVTFLFAPCREHVARRDPPAVKRAPKYNSPAFLLSLL